MGVGGALLVRAIHLAPVKRSVSPRCLAVPGMGIPLCTLV